MKTPLAPSVAAVLLALAWPAAAQVISSPAVATLTDTGVPDGIVFYNGRPFVIRNGRATLIDATLVPNGQILLHDGRLVALPKNYAGVPQGTTQPVTQQGQPAQPGLPLQPGQPLQQGQPAVPGQTATPAAQPPVVPGTVVLPPQTPGANPGTIPGNLVVPSGKTPAGTPAVPGIVDPKNPGAGATTVGPNTRTTGGGNTGATTKSAVSGAATEGGNTSGPAKR